MAANARHPIAEEGPEVRNPTAFLRPLPLLLLLMLIACGRPAAGSLDDAFESLVQTERAFAQTSVTSGTRAAFLEFFAEDGVVFDAGPVNAHSVWEQRLAEGPVLIWGPEIADVSAAGDLGYTSGPYEVRQTHESEPVAWGHFVSVWRRNADGTWNVVADGGIAHGPTALSPDSSVLRVGVPTDGVLLNTEDWEMVRAGLGTFDSEYSLSVSEMGFHESLDQFVDPGARFYRNGQLPLVGLDTIRQTSAQAIGERWDGSVTRDVLVSQSGDMGVTYGVAQFASDTATTSTPSNASYYRIWRRVSGTGWRVVVDVLIPMVNPPSNNDPA